MPEGSSPVRGRSASVTSSSMTHPTPARPVASFPSSRDQGPGSRDSWGPWCSRAVRSARGGQRHADDHPDDVGEHLDRERPGRPRAAAPARCPGSAGRARPPRRASGGRSAVPLAGAAEHVGDEVADASVAVLQGGAQLGLLPAAGGELRLQRRPVGVAQPGVGPDVEGAQRLVERGRALEGAERRPRRPRRGWCRAPPGTGRPCRRSSSRRPPWRSRPPRPPAPATWRRTRR